MLQKKETQGRLLKQQYPGLSLGGSKRGNPGYLKRPLVEGAVEQRPPESRNSRKPVYLGQMSRW